MYGLYWPKAGKAQLGCGCQARYSFHEQVLILVLVVDIAWKSEHGSARSLHTHTARPANCGTLSACSNRLTVSTAFPSLAWQEAQDVRHSKAKLQIAPQPASSGEGGPSFAQ